MAGFVFTDGNLILGGYDDRKECITGFGGKPKNEESVFQTAVREVVEELFELRSIPLLLLQEIENHLVPDEVIGARGYTIFVFSFDDLKFILKTISKYNVESRAYIRVPTTIEELIFNRIPCKELELSYLVVLPCKDSIKLSNYFQSDIHRIRM